MRLTLKAARVNVGLTQEQAAQRIGVSRVTIWNWETAKTLPERRQIPKIEGVYQVSYNDIICIPINHKS